jgi:hypothetical protein
MKELKELLFHVHDDIESLNIPLYYYSSDNCYIMQAERVVYIGSKRVAHQWMKANEGKYIKESPVMTINKTKNRNEENNQQR